MKNLIYASIGVLGTILIGIGTKSFLVGIGVYLITLMLLKEIRND